MVINRGLVKKYGLAALGAGLLALLVLRADLGLLLASLAGARPALVLAACLLQLATIAAIVGQWTDLGRRLGASPADRRARCCWRSMLRVNLTGTFWETVTPAMKSGGEVARVYLLHRDCGLSLGRAVALTGLQKVISLLPLLLLVAMALALFLHHHGLDTPQGRLLAPGLAALVALLLMPPAALLVPRLLLGLAGRLPRLSLSRRPVYRHRLLKGVAEFRRAAARLRHSPPALTGHLLLAAAIWLLFPFKAWLLAWALGIEINLWQAALVTYLAYMVAMLPLTPGGLGTFEAAVIFLAAPFGVATAPALAFAVLLRLVTFWLPFLASALYLVGRLVILRGKIAAASAGRRSFPTEGGIEQQPQQGRQQLFQPGRPARCRHPQQQAATHGRQVEHHLIFFQIPPGHELLSR